MLLTIDNLDGAGVRDYTASVASLEARPGETNSAGNPVAANASIKAGGNVHLVRRLNMPSELTVTLAGNKSFIVPPAGARLVLERGDGVKLFTGYLAQAPAAAPAGWSCGSPVYTYALRALSDEYLLDLRTMPARPPLVGQTAGTIVTTLTESILPGQFDSSNVAAGDTIPTFASNPELRWSEQAAELALRARASYRACDSAISFRPVGTIEYTLDESAASFSPEGLKLSMGVSAAGAKEKSGVPGPPVLNDMTVLAKSEPQAYVKDYFLGDGSSLSFLMSNTPFTRVNKVFVDEGYAGATLDPKVWTVTNAAAVSVAGGLQVSGSPIAVQFANLIELGGALVLQHGAVQFSAASNGLFGGLFAGGSDMAHAWAAFWLQPSGNQTQISAVVNGAVTGTSITTASGQQYVFSTRLYADQIYRRQQTFHSSQHPAGAARGGAEIAANVHVVLEVHVIDPTNPATLVAPSTVLYDGVVANAPAMVSYYLVNASSMNCLIAFTKLRQAVDVDVSSTVPGQTSRTRLVGALTDGAECNVSTRPELYFFSSYPPQYNEAIVAVYRSSGPAAARIIDTNSVAAQARGADDGVRGGVRRVVAPEPRTSQDCENAALALLDDTTQIAWKGQYQTWSVFLPGGAGDVWPGDSLHVLAPSRGADFHAIVREVAIDVLSLADDCSRYGLHFANDAAEPLAFGFGSAASAAVEDVTATTTTTGSTFMADLPDAQVTGVTSTTVSVDAGSTPPAGGGIEARWSDSGWGAANNSNLVGRYSTPTFAVSRLSRVVTLYLRQYDASGRYSQYSTILHVDYPL